MKVLFITNHFLDGNGGGSFASRAYANAFAELADECMILYPDRGNSVKEFINTKYILKGIPSNKNNFNKLLDIYLGRIHRFLSNSIEELNKFIPDVVVFDNSRCSLGLIKIIKDLAVKVITIHHNYEFEYYRDNPPPLLWRIPLMYYVKKAEEIAVLNSDINITLTNQDIVLLKHNYASETDIVLECVGSFEYKYSLTNLTEKFKGNKTRFIITGSLDTFQTEISLTRFIIDFYPNLLSLFPDSELVIAGKSPSKNIKDLCGKFSSIILIENPDNIQDIIRTADVYICPVDVGGGLKLRVMDGLKGGIPILSHEVSSRGYDIFVEKGIVFVYKDSFTFINELMRLLNARNVLSDEYITKIYNDYFSFESGKERLKLVLEKYL